MVRGFLENSTLLGSSINGPNLTTNVEAISARAVVKNGKTRVMAINLTNKPAAFSIQLDGANYNGSFVHKALKFNWLGHERVEPFITNALELVKKGTGAIILPKLSISVIEVKDVTVPRSGFFVAMTAPRATPRAGRSVELTANASTSDGRISQVNFRVNGRFYKRDDFAPYSTTWTPPHGGDLHPGRRSH